MADRQREIYVAATTAQAHLLKNALERQGITAFVANETLQIAAGELPMGVSTAPRVLVAEGDAEEARKIAISFDQSSRERASELDESESDVPDRSWPLCPSCHRPRHTSCPVCGTAGANFPLAYVPSPALAGRALLVVCKTCDEPFEPEFSARCEWCGHRFADGSELPTPAWTDSEMTSRAWVAVVGIVAVVIGVIALFAYIAPRP